MAKQKRDFIKEAYWQRNMLAVMLANKIDGSGWYYDEKAIEKNKPCKRVISIDHGQITFHIPDNLDIGNLPKIKNDWDGHSNEQKWDRISQMCAIKREER